MDLAGFVVRAARRHLALAVFVFSICVLMTLAAVLLIPRAYLVETKMLAQRQVVMPLLSNPRRAVPQDSDSPLKAVDETIRRRDNLISIVKETNLLERWEVGRSPVLKAKDALIRMFLGPLTEDEKIRALVEVLDAKLTVQAAGTSITISLRWHDPQMAFEVVSCMGRNFLNDRRAAETGAIAETIAILEEDATRQREAIDAAIIKVQERVQAVQKAKGGFVDKSADNDVDKAAEKVAVSGRASRAPVSAALTTVGGELAEKRRAIQVRSDAAQRRLADLEAQLVDLRAVYAPAHPSLLVLEEKIRQASMEPPALVELRQAERELLDRVRSVAPRHDDHGLRLFEPATPERIPLSIQELDGEPEIVDAKSKLLMGVREYEELSGRIDAARIELRTAEAAFKYRYGVVEPPEVPKKPVKFSVLIVLLSGLVLSIVAAVCAAFARDLASNRIIESWQTRRLAIPLLAEVDEP